MKRVLLVLTVILTGFISFHNKGKNTSPDFIGMWTLLKCVAYQADGALIYPYGEHPVGQLLYDRKGNMMVEIMKPGIKKFVRSNLLEGWSKKFLPANYGFISYYGSYKIVPVSNLVIHHIKHCSFPNWLMRIKD